MAATSSLSYVTSPVVYFFENGIKKISPFHDIPLVADASRGTFNMVVEIPRGQTAKLEISKTEAYNPIKQDVKSGKLRFVTYGGGYIWNYGAFPQTWEDPNYTHPDTSAKGDNDPLDVCEIGSASPSHTGDVKQVKVLGTMALIDEGETDWKIIAIDVTDPLAEKLNDIDDLEKEKPGFLHETYLWFRDYKTVDGKPPNNFAFDGQAKNREYALHIVQENHDAWRKLISGEVSNVTKGCTIALDKAT